MLHRWQPSFDLRSEFNKLQEEMDRMFGRWGVNPRSLMGRNLFPAVNIWEDSGNLYVEAELPGLELGDLEIYVTGQNQLSLKGQRKLHEASGTAWHRQERGVGSFGRVIELPSPVNSEAVTANLTDGVLLITLPKREEVKPRRIEVKSA
jgi:HSP20 family protein